MARTRRGGDRDRMARELLKPNYRRRRIMNSAKSYKRKPRTREDSWAFSYPSFGGGAEMLQAATIGSEAWRSTSPLVPPR